MIRLFYVLILLFMMIKNAYSINVPVLDNVWLQNDTHYTIRFIYDSSDAERFELFVNGYKDRTYPGGSGVRYIQRYISFSSNEDPIACYRFAVRACNSIEGCSALSEYSPYIPSYFRPIEFPLREASVNLPPNYELVRVYNGIYRSNDWYYRFVGCPSRSSKIIYYLKEDFWNLPTYVPRYFVSSYMPQGMHFFGEYYPVHPYEAMDGILVSNDYELYDSAIGQFIGNFQDVFDWVQSNCFDSMGVDEFGYVGDGWYMYFDVAIVRSASSTPGHYKLSTRAYCRLFKPKYLPEPAGGGYAGKGLSYSGLGFGNQGTRFRGYGKREFRIQ